MSFATRAGALVAALSVTSALALPAGAQPPGGPVSQSNGASIKLGSGSVKAGARMKVSGSGWKSQGSRTGSGKVVTIKLDDSIVIGILPLRDKRFSGSVLIPRQARKGKHTLRFLAASPATSIKSKAFTVR